MAKAKTKQPVKKLILRDYYSRKDMENMYPNAPSGKKYLLVTIKHRSLYLNELHNDGVVHEPRGSRYRIDYGFGQSKKFTGRHILVQYFGIKDYQYIGDEDYIIRYDPKRNKIFLKS